MIPVRFHYAGPCAELARRQISCEPVGAFHARAIARCGAPAGIPAPWEVRLGDTLLFDEGGLRLLAGALEAYGGPERCVELRLVPDPVALRDYYGLHEGVQPDGSVRLPVEAWRTGAAPTGEGAREIVRIPLPASRTGIPFPRSLTEPTEASAPHALLLDYGCDFDLLFANQIAFPAELRRRVPRSPWALAKSLFRRTPHDRALRAALAFRQVAPSAEVHPTAVIEGSVVGPGARVGAHCTVRFSVVGEGARLHDGAKVEFSAIGRGSWLMHDLVAYRCHVEDEVFLIHGPYQFSSFHSRSAAFATILMDWLPQGGPFRVATPRGLREYHGRFLGAVFREGARTLGGTLLAPGRIVPADTWLACDPELIHRKLGSLLPTGTPVAPARAPDAARDPAASAAGTTHAQSPWRNTP